MSLPPLLPEQRIKPKQFELRMSLIYVAIFAPMGIHLPYFPLWLEAHGFGPGEIAIILSVPMFLRVLSTPFIMSGADKARDRLDVFAVVAVCAFISSLGYFLPVGYGLVLAVSVLLAMFWTPHGPLADSIALSGVRRWRSDYAGMRLWGSAAFLVGNVIGGIAISRSGVASVPWMISIGLASVVVAVLAGPRLGRPRVASPAASVADLPATDVRLFDTGFLLFVTGAACINASHGLAFGFSSIYWTSLGIDAGYVGALWAFSVVCEVVVLGIYRRAFGGITPGGLLVFAGIAGILRWTVFPFVWEMGAGLPGFFLIQGLHAFSTGFLLVGVQLFIAQRIPEERTGAAQGIAFSANGLMMALATLASGPLYAAFGSMAFLTMAVVAALGTALVVMSAAGRVKRD